MLPDSPVGILTQTRLKTQEQRARQRVPFFVDDAPAWLLISRLRNSLCVARDVASETVGAGDHSLARMIHDILLRCCSRSEAPNPLDSSLDADRYVPQNVAAQLISCVFWVVSVGGMR